jgi:anti-sigma factor RsiW
MTHPHLEVQLDAYLDGELAPAEARDIETHLGQCPECTRFIDSRLALRSAIKARAPQLTAPAALRTRVAKLRSTPKSFTLWRSLALAASLAVVALGGWQLGLQRGLGDALADDVLTAHVRSLMPGHLTDVPSSDRHTVKPWFNGKLDYSPPVYDFADRGYPLLGGRLDYVNGRTVSALVYGRRQHVINVLVWPSNRDAGRPPGERASQGYHVLHWIAGDYSYWAVSDLALPELQEFTGFLRAAAGS